MQTRTFTNGGAVVHRVMLDSSNCRFSVWTTPAGEYSSAARYDALNRELEPTPGQVQQLTKRAPGLHRLAHTIAESK